MVDVTSLALMPWFDIVLGMVPDYMHGCLLGITKTLLYKWFSSTNYKKDFFIGGQVMYETTTPLLSLTYQSFLELNYNFYVGSVHTVQAHKRLFASSLFICTLIQSMKKYSL